MRGSGGNRGRGFCCVNFSGPSGGGGPKLNPDATATSQAVVATMAASPAAITAVTAATKVSKRLSTIQFYFSNLCSCLLSCKSIFLSTEDSVIEVCSVAYPNV
jgi:hypothetical protein